MDMDSSPPPSSTAAAVAAARKRAHPADSPSPSPSPSRRPGLRHQTTLRIPFPSAHLASIAARVLSVDRPLKPQEAYATYDVVDDGRVFEMTVHANSIRMLRTTVNANLDQIVSVTNTMAQLSPAGLVSDQN